MLIFRKTCIFKLNSYSWLHDFAILIFFFFQSAHFWKMREKRRQADQVTFDWVNRFWKFECLNRCQESEKHFCTSVKFRLDLILIRYTVENNALVFPHFISTPSNRKISTPLLRPYEQTVFKVHAKVRKSTQFENFGFLCHQNWLMKQIFQLLTSVEWSEISIRAVFWH